MPNKQRYTIKYDPVSQTIIVRFTTTWNAQTNIDAFNHAIERYDVTKINFLWDLRRASFSQFSIQEIKKLRAFRSDYSALRGATKSCALVDESVKKSLMQLYHEINLGVGPDTPVFLLEHEARAYLGIAPTVSFIPEG
ncbi:MAG: hypothetical protein P1U88_14025 [Thalassobaculaceae bacterium]|nr:hypothetical protein [Thalassobaculaceae bacterium]